MYSSSEEYFFLKDIDNKSDKFKIKFLYHGQYNIPTIRISNNMYISILYYQNKTI